ncbi:helix-turn-helix transcriptional regulator [Steroidobacter sp. S1-65]|uniref:Helix-turn-helix transcriptional regulator n=1 Tax=Steroidobacter gossypii TaxID=2805490 RepID=A0ABS1X0N5_9GAMM|nr:winged helix-turn-helix domain-containing protein [Steroidobacter gossypii]MBM0106772.1 helix-turn-helix transcriptional regulator [Steroidobacter gossypii]
MPVALGDRALDILIALVERAGEVVSQRDLTARVWRDLVVSPSNLRVHMSALRKALGDGENGTRYIENVTGQGYCFVAPIARAVTAASTAKLPELPDAVRKRLVLPPKLPRMLGREPVVRCVADDLLKHRFITIIGPGGMGKTTVAIAVAHAMRDGFADVACFVDIGAIADPKLVGATIAASLGLQVQTEDATPALLEHLRTLRLLLILDNCEHVIEPVATLAETLFKDAPALHILATSREALRVEGERAYWLPALASPAPDSSMKAADVLAFPAVQLFMERAAASGGHFELNDESAALVAGICGRLEGLALAIELAAGRVGSHGLAATADLLNKNLGLDWHGRRTALPRHQTLRALLDWSYWFLPADEQAAMRRLSVLVGDFTLEAASTIIRGESGNDAATLNTLDALVAKSLVSVHSGDAGTVRYRLLETTRIYGLEKLHESGEADSAARCHAEYFKRLLDERHGGLIDLEYTGRAHALREHLGNIRSALEWCFSRSGGDFDVALAVDLAAAAASVFLELSLLGESYRWSSAGLAALDDSTRGGRREMLLRSSWAISSMWIRGGRDDVLSAIARTLELADPLAEPSQRLRMLATRHLFLTRVADFRGALVAAEEWDVAARQVNDVSCLAISELMQGVARHFLGDQAGANKLFDAGFARAGERNLQLCGNDHRVRGLVVMSRALWLSGFPERAIATARQAATTAMKSGKPLDTCFALLYTTPVYLWCGHWDAVQSALDQLVRHTHWPLLKPFHPVERAMQGTLLIGRGSAEAGASLLNGVLQQMRDERQDVARTFVACAIADGLTLAGRPEEALTILRTIRRNAVPGAESVQLPELLRLQANALLSLEQTNEARAERLLLRSSRIARRQSALAWELRTAMTLARLRYKQGQSEQARDLLAGTYGRFTEGFGTQDLQQAAQLLRDLGHTEGFLMRDKALSQIPAAEATQRLM